MWSFFVRVWAGVLRSLLPVAAGILAGCASDSGSSGGAGSKGAAPLVTYSDVLSKGDAVTITFSGNPTPPEEQEERIKEDGTINLQFVGPVVAVGKTPGELQKEIQALYVPRFFVRLTVTVRTENRVFFVDGEVRSPGRLVYTGQISVLRAIASAGGFTDFAARGRVELVRGTGEIIKVDARKARNNPKLDPLVVPGDSIIVPRRSPFGR